MKKALILVLWAFLMPVTLQSQESFKATLIEFDGKIALFSVDATAAKGSDVASAAMDYLFRTLLTSGVEGVENGRKLMEKDNPKWFDNFFKEKNPPYMAYVKGYQTEGDPLRTSVGTYRATVLVKVNIEFFLRQLKAYGIRN